MARTPERLVVFRLAQELCVSTYRLANELPTEERFGLTAQLKRAAVSVVCNIAEGSSRQSGRDYARFIEIAAGSAVEVRSLIELSNALGFIDAGQSAACKDCADHVFRALLKLQQSLTPIGSG